MSRFRLAGLLALVTLGATCLPFLASPASAIVAGPRTTPSIGKQLAELKGSDTGAGDGLGVAVAVSGRTAVVGAPGGAKDAGRAYVFAKTGDVWNQAAELKGSGTVGGDFFGYSVAISGTTVFVGAPGYAKNAGRAYVFAKTGTGWRQAAELKGSDTAAGDYFGDLVSISGQTAIVGADGYGKNAGRAYLFVKTGTGWRQAADLKGSDTAADDGFGYSVAISGTTALVGAPDKAKGTGRAYVFTDTPAGWRQAAELKGSDTAAGDGVGVSVAVSGTTAVVGAPGYAKNVGRAYVFTDTANGWEQAAELKGSDTAAGDDLGFSVAVSGTTAVVGAPGHAKDAGWAYLYAKTGSGWRQAAELKGSDTAADDYFGYSVAVSGATALAGADGHAKSAGRAYVFEA